MINYQAGFDIACACGQPLIDSLSLPIGDKWQRLSFALAGYGYVVPGSWLDAVPAASSLTAAEVCQASSTITPTCSASSSIEII